MLSACDASTLEALGPLWGVLGAVVGVVVGWLLNQRSAAKAAVSSQRREAAASLLDALVDARLRTQVLRDREAAQSELAVADREWRRAVLRYSGRISDESLTRRLDAASVALHLAHTGGTDESRSRPAIEGTDLGSLTYIVERAFLDVFVCLDAFLNDKPLPAVSFPPDPIVVMTEGDPITQLRAKLNEYPEPERTARTRIMLAL